MEVIQVTSSKDVEEVLSQISGCLRYCGFYEDIYYDNNKDRVITINNQKGDINQLNSYLSESIEEHSISAEVKEINSLDVFECVDE
jgi:hypothetical protein